MCAMNRRIQIVIRMAGFDFHLCCINVDEPVWRLRLWQIMGAICRPA